MSVLIGISDDIDGTCIVMTIGWFRLKLAKLAGLTNIHTCSI